MQSLTSRLHTRILSHIPKCDKTRFLWLKVDHEDYGYEIFGRLGFRASPKWPARSGQWPSVSSDVFPGLYWGYRLPQATRFLPSSNPKLSVDHTATEEGGRGSKEVGVAGMGIGRVGWLARLNASHHNVHSGLTDSPVESLTRQLHELRG